MSGEKSDANSILVYNIAGCGYSGFLLDKLIVDTLLIFIPMPFLNTTQPHCFLFFAYIKFALNRPIKSIKKSTTRELINVP